MKKLKKLPKFKTENEEFEFWSKFDSTEFVNWDAGSKVQFTKLKKTTRSITLDLPADLLEKIIIRANKIDVHVESLLKMYILKAYQDNSRSYKI
ncbi:MAG: BrnA antitoxin family protein [Bacteroidetes bacterium]|nr:BrnA antitoxin family protein [Bacteroidota bacterium]